jgi:hypothetical protein
VAFDDAKAEIAYLVEQPSGGIDLMDLRKDLQAGITALDDYLSLASSADVDMITTGK